MLLSLRLDAPRACCWAVLVLQLVALRSLERRFDVGPFHCHAVTLDETFTHSRTHTCLALLSNIYICTSEGQWRWKSNPVGLTESHGRPFLRFNEKCQLWPSAFETDHTYDTCDYVYHYRMLLTCSKLEKNKFVGAFQYGLIWFVEKTVRFCFYGQWTFFLQYVVDCCVLSVRRTLSWRWTWSRRCVHAWLRRRNMENSRVCQPSTRNYASSVSLDDVWHRWSRVPQGHEVHHHRLIYLDNCYMLFYVTLQLLVNHCSA